MTCKAYVSAILPSPVGNLVERVFNRSGCQKPLDNHSQHSLPDISTKHLQYNKDRLNNKQPRLNNIKASRQSLGTKVFTITDFLLLYLDQTSVRLLFPTVPLWTLLTCRLEHAHTQKKREAPVMDWIFVYLFPLPPNSYTEILDPNVVISGGEAFGKSLVHKEEILVNGIRALIRRHRTLSLCFPLCKETTWREPSTSKEVGPHQAVDLLVSWSGTSQSPEWRNECELFNHLVYDDLL